MFVAPVTAVALLLYGNEPLTRRFLRAFAWGLGTLTIKDHRRWVVVFAALAIPLGMLNLFLNHAADIDGSRNAPEQLVAEPNSNVRKDDIFVVLSDADWYGALEYEILFRYLQVASAERGVAILNDFVLPANDSPQWRNALSQKIDSTLKHGAACLSPRIKQLQICGLIRAARITTLQRYGGGATKCVMAGGSGPT